MKNKKNNKKNLIIISIVSVFIIFVVGIAIYLSSYSNNYSFSEKQWISSNTNNVLDISVTSSLPMFSEGGDGVYYNFLNALAEDTGLSFNVVSDGTGGYNFTVVNEFSENDVVFYKDNYVVISSSNTILNDISSLQGFTIGVLAEDLSYISDYLSETGGLTFSSYNTINGVTEALNESIVYAIVPLNKYIDDIMYNSFNIVYHIDDLNSYYVLKLSEPNSQLTSIMKKFYTRWSDRVSEVYNERLLSLYYDATDLTQMQKESITSDDFIIGYISDMPYSGLVNRSYSGLLTEYLDSFADFAGVSYKYVEYSNYNALENAIKNKKVDLILNSYGISNAAYSNSTSLGDLEYVVLAHKENDLYLNSLKGLKSTNIIMLDKTNLYYSLKDTFKESIIAVDSVKKLFKKLDQNSVVILPSIYYEYYMSNKLEDYTVRYTSNVAAYNTFLMNNENSAFNNLFNFYLTMQSSNKVELRALNSSLNKLNSNVFVAFILKNIIYFGALACALVLILYKFSHKIQVTKKIKKEDKMMFLDVMTNLKNRNYLNENIEYWDNNKIYPQAIVSVDLMMIKSLNDQVGRTAGDNQIKACANILIKTQRENSEIIRTDGDEFIIYLVGYDEKQILTYLHKLNKEFKSLPYASYGVALGYSMITDDIKNIDDAINEAVSMSTQNKGEVSEK